MPVIVVIYLFFTKNNDYDNSGRKQRTRGKQKNCI